MATTTPTLNARANVLRSELGRLHAAALPHEIFTKPGFVHEVNKALKRVRVSWGVHSLWFDFDQVAVLPKAA